MRKEIKRAVAFVLKCIYVRRENVRASGLFDENNFEFVNVNGLVNDTQISIFDYQTGQRIVGEISNDIISIYLYGIKQLIKIQLANDSFVGYDSNNNELFFGELTDHRISISDNREISYFQCVA
jgi:hypothetical protein